MVHKAFACSICRKKFTTSKGTLEHIETVHSAHGEVVNLDRQSKRRPSDDEPSFADLAVEAEINKAAGLPYEGWLLGE